MLWETLVNCQIKDGAILFQKLLNQHISHPGAIFRAFHVQNILINKYGFSNEEAVNMTQNFLKSFRRCPESMEYPLHDWRHLLWKKCLGEKNSEISGTPLGLRTSSSTAEKCEVFQRERLKRLRESFCGGRKSEGEIYCQWLSLRYKYIAPSSEMISLLESLRNTYYLALITNGPSNSQWEKIRRLRLTQYFDLILVSGDLNWEKPNENIFLEACIHLGVPPSKCLMVGDKLETDILGGIKAGLGGTVWFPLSKNSILGGDLIVPDWVVNDVAGLKCLLSSKTTSRRTFQTDEVGRFLPEKVFSEGNDDKCIGGS